MNLNRRGQVYRKTFLGNGSLREEGGYKGVDKKYLPYLRINMVFNDFFRGTSI